MFQLSCFTLQRIGYLVNNLFLLGSKIRYILDIADTKDILCYFLYFSSVIGRRHNTYDALLRLRFFLNVFNILIERGLDTENVMEHDLHALITASRKWFATV